MSNTHPDESAKVIPMPQPTNDRIKVLVIDDCMTTLGVASHILQSAGMDVITHQHPLEAGHMIVKHQPDVVLLDVEMPVIRGDQLLDIIRKNSRTHATRVLLHSSIEEDRLRQMALDRGADGFVRKSAGAADLAQAIRKALEARESVGQPRSA